jgi:hypothetical protein
VVSSTVDHVREQGHGGELNVCDRWKNPGKHGKRVTRLREKAQMEGERGMQPPPVHHHA